MTALPPAVLLQALVKDYPDVANYFITHHLSALTAPQRPTPTPTPTPLPCATPLLDFKVEAPELPTFPTAPFSSAQIREIIRIQILPAFQPGQIVSSNVLLDKTCDYLTDAHYLTEANLQPIYTNGRAIPVWRSRARQSMRQLAALGYLRLTVPGSKSYYIYPNGSATVPA